MIEAVAHRHPTDAREITRQHLASMAENIRAALELSGAGRARIDALLTIGALAPRRPAHADGGG
jgi:hypothetical protein